MVVQCVFQYVSRNFPANSGDTADRCVMISARGRANIHGHAEDQRLRKNAASSGKVHTAVRDARKTSPRRMDGNIPDRSFSLGGT